MLQARVICLRGKTHKVTMLFHSLNNRFWHMLFFLCFYSQLGNVWMFQIWLNSEELLLSGCKVLIDNACLSPSHVITWYMIDFLASLLQYILSKSMYIQCLGIDWCWLYSAGAYSDLWNNLFSCELRNMHDLTNLSTICQYVPLVWNPRFFRPINYVGALNNWKYHQGVLLSAWFYLQVRLFSRWYTGCLREPFRPWRRAPIGRCEFPELFFRGNFVSDVDLFWDPCFRCRPSCTQYIPLNYT